MFQVIALAHLAATLFMVGVIWFVQVVHYPLMAGQTPEYAREHQRRTGWVLGPVMLVELGTAVALAGIAPTWASVGGLVLLVAVWASTWGVQVPCHRKLLNKPDPTALHRLVATNWVRTALWTTRGGLAVVLIL
ncbi:MAG: hypothetical protein MUF18_21220 [Fimbriiglobus sp.]|nr:hypothetical protein [Fimbriiglobus sp.]